MVDGPSSVLKPSGDATVSVSGPDGFSTLDFPANGAALLQSSRPVQLTSFNIRVGKTCSDGTVLKVEVKYFYLDMAGATVGKSLDYF